MAKDTKRSRHAWKRVSSSVNGRSVHSSVIGRDYVKVRAASPIPPPPPQQQKIKLDVDDEWTEAQTLDYLDDLIERNAEALDGLSKL